MMKLLRFEGYKVVIEPEILTLKPFKQIWTRDKSINKDRAISEISYIYFMADPRSDYQYITDENERKQAIKTGKQKSKTSLTDSGISIVTCDYCFAVVKASEVKNGKCPICGKPIKVHEAKTVSDVVLVEATKARQKAIREIVKNDLLKKVANKSVNELHSMKELQAYAKLHGYKKGWAWFQAKRKGLIKG